MAFLLSCQSVTKSFGPRPLFREITLGVDDGERLGLIGPNGAGKSTLLKILAGEEKPDSGAVSARRGLRIGFVSQNDAFPEGSTVQSVLEQALAGSGLDPHEKEFEIGLLLGRMEFTDPAQAVHTLSGGWKKRLAVARTLIQKPDLLLLDEPTNHLDIEGILWLEQLLKESTFAVIVVTHDRYFLERVTTRIVELNRAYPEGYLSVNGPYSTFLEQREALLAGQVHQQQALASRVRREVEWLRRNPQARTTKAQYRIDQAGRLIDELGDLRYRNSQGKSVDIDFTSSQRKTREVLAVKRVAKSQGGKKLFSGVDFVLRPGDKLGLLGPNGSGKTTLIRLITGELEPDEGAVTRADGLRIVYFDQNRAPLDRKSTLRNALSPGGDTVLFRGSSMHVAAWAKRFLFHPDQLEMPVGTLSGGEQARVMIARLMLQPADLLILDEPTNDLDIASLEVLEDGLQEFPGALLLVTHDRFLLDQVSTELLALDGEGGVAMLADFAQWEALQEGRQRSRLTSTPSKTREREEKAPTVPRLNSAERRELNGMEATIMEAEEKAAKLEASLATPEIATDAAKLHECWEELQKTRDRITALYSRWDELETRRAATS